MTWFQMCGEAGLEMESERLAYGLVCASHRKSFEDVSS